MPTVNGDETSTAHQLDCQQPKPHRSPFGAQLLYLFIPRIALTCRTNKTAPQTLAQRIPLHVLTLLLFLPPPIQAAMPCGPAFGNITSGGKYPFVVYEGLLYRGMPDLSRHGITKLPIVDRGIWSALGDKAPPDPEMVAKVVRTFPANTSPIVLDFEGFSLNGTDKLVQESIERIKQISTEFRRQAPDRKIGNYGPPPIRDYWRSIQRDRNNPKFKAWQTENDRLAELEGNMDLLFPSLYTFYNNPTGWQTFAISQICEARRLSTKPVIAFLWPEFHDSGTSNKEPFIDAEFWKLQLTVVKEYADGIVLWGGYDLKQGRPRNWDESAAWWSETKLFMEKKQK